MIYRFSTDFFLFKNRIYDFLKAPSKCLKRQSWSPLKRVSTVLFFISQILDPSAISIL